MGARPVGVHSDAKGCPQSPAARRSTLTSTPTPRSIAGYRVLDVLGQGGTGVVYLAQQEEPFERLVALKVLKLQASEQAIQRFLAERQALAMMDHPSIAKIFDAGTTGEGRPYLAMERVDGAPITGFCDHHRLSVRQRVRLFVEVCMAVQHAHQKGVLHRDLKPSNVLVSMVDGTPQPRIIDFGIARAVELDGADLTIQGQLLGTPAYMSPEQFDEPATIDTRADIFSLGVILYELVLGARPLDDSAYRGWAAYAAVLTRAVPSLGQRLDGLPPDQVARLAESRSTTTHELRRALKGDLAWIASTATDRDRERRYESAAGLALELERYLEHRPLRARPSTPGYRLARFVRRNRAGSIAALLSVVGLVAFGVWQSIQSDRIRRARDRADARRAQAEAVLDFMLDSLRAKLEPIGRLDILDDVGQTAALYFAAIPEEDLTDSELLSRSQALYQIGQVRLEQGRLPEAEATFEESRKLAAALRERDPSDNDRLFGLSQAEFWVGEAARRQGDQATALSYFTRYAEQSRELADRDPDNPTYRVEVAYGYNNVGTVLRSLGRLEEAEASFQRSLGVREDLLEQSPGDIGRIYDLANAHHNLGVLQDQLNRYQAAAENLERAIDLEGRLLAEAPEDARWKDMLADTRSFRGSLALVMGDVHRAQTEFEAMHALRTELATLDPSNARWRRSEAISHGLVASVARASGDPASARTHYEQGLEIFRGLLRTDPDQRVWQRERWSHHSQLGVTVLESGDLQSAIQLLQEASRELRALHEAQPDAITTRALARARLQEAEGWSAAGRADSARVASTEAVELLEALARESTERRVVDPLTRALVLAGREADATPWIDLLVGSGYAHPEWLEALALTAPTTW